MLKYKQFLGRPRLMEYKKDGEIIFLEDARKKKKDP